MTEDIYRGRTALVIDDDRAVRLIVRRMLERLGFAVEEAHDGQAALAVVSRTGFHLVVTDLSMPGMTGLEFLRQARNLGLAAPVIVLTATGSVPKAVEAIRCGAYEFIEKPVRVQQLERVIASAMSAPATEQGPLALDIDVQEPVSRVMPTASERIDDSVLREEASILTVDPETASLSLDIAVESPRVKTPIVPLVGGTARIGRYEVVSRIGKGGMGIVYRCRDSLLGRIVAVKVLHAMSDMKESSVELSARFKREAAAAAAMNHPCIVEIHDLGFDEDLGDWYIVMELLSGRGMGQILTEKGRLGPTEAISIGFQLADALAYAHARGVVHRDIKPSNVLVRDDGVAKLLDFGLAAMEGWKVTTDGRVFGSPSYMAPERIQGEPGGPHADQFSLGVLLYEALDGPTPSSRTQPMAACAR